ncbi:zinc fingers and homeoboxes protein 2 [Pseudorasbora parva]|uniref:zinc fingers and homeoboxes protein 2 n=1 Tax=Pseudorasbora parva TaxID=51549 RepID=UPI00351E8740
MSSRRKASNPCVLRATRFTPEHSMDVSAETAPAPPPTDGSGIESLNEEEEEEEKGEGGSASEQGSFNTHNYRDHEDFPHSEGPLNVRTICNFRTNNFDSLSCRDKVQHASCLKLGRTVTNGNDGSRMDAVNELGLFARSSSAGEDTRNAPMLKRSVLEKGLEMEKDKIVNGRIFIPEPICHVTPLLQRPPNLSTCPAVAVPLHTRKYNPVLDHNTILIRSFSRFPYPTVAELSWLTAASRHPEDQIKVWFTTQRLKQGITWSPEEVEEARKKMFNGSIPALNHPCVVPPAGETPNPRQANILPATCTPGSSTALRQTLKRSLGTPLLASEVKTTGDLRESLRMPPPPAPPPKKLAIGSSPGFSETKTSSPSSLLASDMNIPAYFVPSKGSLPMVQSNERKPVALPLGLSKERLPLSPINLKRSLIHQQINNQTSASIFVPKNKSSCFGNGVTVPSTILQTLASPPLSPSPTSVLPSTEPPIFPYVPKEIPNGDVKHWSFDQTTDSQNSCEHSLPTQFPLLERAKDKSPGQIRLLEESFQRNSFPSHNEVEHLMITTRLSREELESWFLERRALRDYLEQVLLNSMGSKQESQQLVLNGAQRRTHTFSPVPPKSKTTNLAKNLLVQSQWPSPVEFRHLETQMAHRELIHWFRDSRLTPQSLERNGCQERPIREENTNPRSPEMENWLDNTLVEGATGDSREDCGNACQPLSHSS